MKEKARDDKTQRSNRQARDREMDAAVVQVSKPV